MFGGYRIFLGELIFGLIRDNSLYLKADKRTENYFLDKGLEPFTYIKKGKRLKISYYQAPEEALDDSNEIITWANMAYSTALRSASKNISQCSYTTFQKNFKLFRITRLLFTFLFDRQIQ